MERLSSRKHIFTAACIGIFTYGIVLAVLGAVLPSLILKFGLDRADAGSLFLLLSFGLLTGSVIFGPIVDRYGYRWILIAGTLLTGLGFAGLSLSPTIGWLLLSLFVTGFSGGLMNGSVSAMVSDISAGSRSSGLNFMGVFFGIGAFGTPFLMGSFLDQFRYELIIGSLGFLFLLPIFYYLRILFPRPERPRGFPVREAWSLLKNRTLLLFGVLLFIQAGVEVTVGGWAAEYLHEVVSVEANFSVLLLSLYWLGLMLARLAAGYSLKRFSDTFVFRVSVGIGMAGALMMLSAGTPGLAVCGLVLTGIGFGPVFPLILGMVGEAYTRLSGTAFSVVFIFGSTGSMIFPYFTGLLAHALGLRAAFVLLPIGLICSLLLFRIVHAKMVEQQKAEDLKHQTA